MPVPMIWFDFGGVLSPPQQELFAAYQRKTGISAAQLVAGLRAVGEELGQDALAALELGRISEPDWGHRLARALSGAGVDVSRARLETFGEQWFAGVRANPSVIRAVQVLRGAGYRVGVLSNNVREWEPYWLRMIAPAGRFDCVIDSSKVGSRKPETRIFRIAEAAAGAAADTCVLVDDLAENCAAAVDAGWQAVHFHTAGRGLSDLGDLLGLPGLPASCAVESFATG